MNDFKKRTTELWSSRIVNPAIRGFQIQPGTSWLPGHSEAQLSEIKTLLGFEIPQDVIHLLKFTAGLDKPMINVLMDNKFLDQWHLKSEYLKSNYKDNLAYLKKTGSIKELQKIVKRNFKIIPILAHRYIVCGDHQDLKVYSMHGSDVIVYGNDLKNYLEKEFLK